jgi:site-specific DNA-methyltransferase (adenine-specific)
LINNPVYKVIYYRKMFIQQVFRKDVLINMLQNANMNPKELFRLLINSNTKSRRGQLYETLCQILIYTKCMNVNYTHIYTDQIQQLKSVTNILKLLNVKIGDGNRGGISDITVGIDGKIVAFSVKYREKYGETDVCRIETELKNTGNDSRIGLIVKDKAIITNHKYRNNRDVRKILHDKIISDGLLFDETDVVAGISTFTQRFKNTSYTTVINTVNSEYLKSRRLQLRKMFHQRMAELKFIRQFQSQLYRMWCLSHKPRSGKSITILCICRHLLSVLPVGKILITTSVPSTIRSFIETLDAFTDFNGIQYSCNELETTTLISGIFFCSTEYLKQNPRKKRTLLKSLAFDAIVIDESHQGSSTDKTRDDILKDVKYVIFASGTPSKTIEYYNINRDCVYDWDIEDESYMKMITRPEIQSIMERRHGEEFKTCINDLSLNRDYSKYPTQVLMKYTFPQTLVDMINDYNTTNRLETGYHCGAKSLLRLQYLHSQSQYTDDFEICNSIDGQNILRGFFECIISQNPMKNTIMKRIERIQHMRGSRMSSVDNPRLFIVYLPVNTGNGTISLLQRAIKRFLTTHNLWSDYNVEYCNSTDDSGDISEDYTDYISTIMTKTKTMKRRGCILLLGNKGSVGVTYNDCDVTISLDDGHNIDSQRQRYSRALTEAVGKTIGINVDMNIQRVYSYTLGVISRYRKYSNTNMNNGEILKYMHDNNMFLFDPLYFEGGNVKTIDIAEYYRRENINMLHHVDDTPFLNEIVCSDNLRDIIKCNTSRKSSTQTISVDGINAELFGEQPECPTGIVTIPMPQEQPEQKEEKEEKEEEKNEEPLINYTYEICKTFLFPLMALIARSYKITDFRDIFTLTYTRDIVFSLLKSNKIELSHTNYFQFITFMNEIITENAEIVNSIREIYNSAPSDKLRMLIELHFVPSEDERKTNAEVATPTTLVEEMLDSIPVDFWKSPKRVFEPCCGKGNFVLGIFDRFYNGLEGVVSCNYERCKTIINDCLYYGDISLLNTFITTELLKCHIQSYCGVDEFDEFSFNCYTGDTLILDIGNFARGGFDLVVGNPPYSTDPSKANTTPLYNKFIEKYIDNKLLLFVVPSRWFVGGKGLDSFREFMTRRKDIVFIRHEENSKKWFTNVKIEGGVNYFLKDSNYDGLCRFNGVYYDLSKYDSIINPKYHQIIDAVINRESINKLYKGRCFGVETNDPRFREAGNIKCYVSLQKSRDRCKYLDSYEFNDTNTFWKVITARANGKNPNFGIKFIGTPDEVHTGSYISFRVNTREEALSLLSYLDTKFANYMLSIRKISQDISENTCKWIPLVPLDRTWNDEKVCEYLNINQDLY